ncbi:DUF1775 domain-containing protein [Cellulosimicrobium sp. CUA-896]|uniref:DUF1775 domain-containing protein n=1 Tax=Cellulosimicrobium sp. CUA-896 TaxID=1517881 RepID=UPI0009621E16|nr:DUF1775 domain-containing protein [Cellulosimicrobium sp. CUA-896]OLT52616.1 hypothetical protein BJF88_13410 [Cellulosimicrobium sp. CUA-896]
MRKSLRATAVAALATGLVATGATVASAHVTVTPSVTTADSYTVLTFAFGHGCGESATTEIAIQMPEQVISVAPAVHPGWDVEKVMQDLETPVDDGHGGEYTERVAEVVYTAKTPVPNGYRDSFELSLKLPDAAGETLDFPTVQTCEEGETAWVEIPAEGQTSDDLESPARRSSSPRPTPLPMLRRRRRRTRRRKRSPRRARRRTTRRRTRPRTTRPRPSSRGSPSLWAPPASRSGRSRSRARAAPRADGPMTRTARRPVPHRAPALAVVVAAAALLLAVLAGGPAAAHAVLLGTDPEDGTVLDAPPDDLTITFNEPVRAVESGTTLLSADGAEVAVDVAARDAALVVTPAEPLADGTYVVSWRVVSLDSHPVAGAFSFSVGAPSGPVGAGAAGAAAEPSAGVEVARAVDQTAVYLGTFLVAGLVVLELLVLPAPPGGMPRLRSRLHRARRLGLAVAGVGLALGVPLTAAWQAGRSLDALLEGSTWTEGLTSDTGVAAALGVAGLLGATLLAPRAARESRALWPAGVALGASGLALSALVLVGHTRTFGPAPLVVAADVLHVVAGAVWFGGVVGLVLVLAPSAQVDPRRAAVTVTRFSALGAWVVLALAVTGVVLGWRILGTVDALVTTAYGQTLLVKVGVALVIVALAAWNRYRLVPSFAARAARRTTSVVGMGADAEVSRRLGRTVAAEAGLLVVVLAVTGLLVSRSPVDAAEQAGSPPGSDVATPVGVDVTRPLGEGTLRARVTPGAVGVNALELVLLDADGEPLEPVDAPELSTRLAEPALGPFTRPVTRTGPGTYEATLDLPMPGAWTVSVSVRTSKYDNPIVEIPVEVAS